MIQGHCLCGDIQWEHAGKPLLMSSCHCSVCRKTLGSAFTMEVVAGSEGYRLVRGDERIRSYQTSPGFLRPFCSRCGSPLPIEAPGGNFIAMPAGCVEGDPGLRPSSHVFVASKAPWHEISDDLRRFDAYPANVDLPVVERPRSTKPREGAVRGSCHCGLVAYEIEGELGDILYCHCGRCRKAHGTAYASILLLAETQFRWLCGEDLVQRYKVPEAQRFTHCFCRTCGSSLPEVHPGQGVVAKIGTLDDDPGVRAGCHIFTGSKAVWDEISDELPQYEEYPTPRSPDGTDKRA